MGSAFKHYSKPRRKKWDKGLEGIKGMFEIFYHRNSRIATDQQKSLAVRKKADISQTPLVWNWYNEPVPIGTMNEPVPRNTSDLFIYFCWPILASFLGKFASCYLLYMFKKHKWQMSDIMIPAYVSFNTLNSFTFTLCIYDKFFDSQIFMMYGWHRFFPSDKWRKLRLSDLFALNWQMEKHTRNKKNH